MTAISPMRCLHFPVTKDGLFKPGKIELLSFLQMTASREESSRISKLKDFIKKFKKENGKRTFSREIQFIKILSRELMRKAPGGLSYSVTYSELQMDFLNEHCREDRKLNHFFEAFLNKNGSKIERGRSGDREYVLMNICEVPELWQITVLFFTQCTFNSKAYLSLVPEKRSKETQAHMQREIEVGFGVHQLLPTVLMELVMSYFNQIEFTELANLEEVPLSSL